MKRLIMILVLFASLNIFAEDMMKYLMNTEKLVQDGKNQEALEGFVWLYDHALEHDPAFCAVRLSAVLSYWKELADKYPPALKSLQEVRDRESELIKGGKGTWDTFHEAMSLNRVLKEEEKSIELFIFMDEKYPELAKKCWNLINSKMIAAKKFDLVRKYLPNPNLMKEFNKIALYYKRYKTSEDETLKKFDEDSFVNKTLDLIITAREVIKDNRMAEEIREKAFEILPDSRLKQ